MKQQSGISSILTDHDAQDKLYREHHERLLAIARHYISDDDTARDVEHDAWVMILSSLDTLRDGSKLDTWMGSIVRNMALNYLKQNSQRRMVSLDDVEDAKVSLGDDESESLPVLPLPEILGMVKKLPQGYERVFRLNTFEGMSHEQIGRLLGISAVGSRSQLSRARKMLQLMMRQRWAMLTLALAAAVFTVYRLMTRTSDVTDVPDVAHSTEQSKPEITPQANVDMPPRKEPAVAQPPVQHVDAVKPHSTSYAKTTPKEYMDTSIHFDMRHDAPLDLGDIGLARHQGLIISQPAHPEMALINPVEPAVQTHSDSRSKWSMHLAYSDVPGGQSTIVDNFLSVINFATGETSRSTHLFTWGDYYKYVNENAALMDSIDASRMNFITERHIGDKNYGDPYNDQTPLSETKHHYRPRTFGLSFNYPLSSRWNLASGLQYTYMKSVFEADNGNGNDITRRTQRLHYVGVPLGVTCNIWQRGRWQIYGMGNLKLDIPVHGKETTQFIYIGPYEHAPGDSIVFPTTHATVKAPLQWSVGVGVGVQYRLSPHVKLYFEPSFRYYFPTNTPVETWRTAHPFDVAFPLGIRFVP